jgi:hypothetical protein
LGIQDRRFALTHATFRSLILAGAILGISATVHAQQPAAAPAAADAPPPAATAPAATTAPAAAPAAAASAAASPKAADDVPSPAVLKKAHAAGYYTKVRHGNVVYCKSDAVLGTRFTSENCINQDQLEQTLLQAQAQRDQLQHSMTPSRTP